MHINNLKHRVTFKKRTTTLNENGFEVESFQDIKTVWAGVENLRGREYFAAAAVQAEKTVKFSIRYLPYINASMLISFKDKLYNITAIDNVNYENRFLEISAMEVDESGKS
ncbi:phage head closure protein [Proteinivorax tanatarense]|uniref:Phage head closure protein n=1 Tax=Proteinivorax tanatarense TaxID=1260629 RepID=A0AAU7VH56_9FIRM